MGNFAGLGDLFFFEKGARGEPGLMMEVKTPSGQLREVQRARLCSMHARGYAVCLVRSPKEALEELTKFGQELMAGKLV